MLRPIERLSGLDHDRFVQYYEDDLVDMYYTLQDRLFQHQCNFEHFTYFVWVHSSRRRPDDFADVMSRKASDAYFYAEG